MSSSLTLRAGLVSVLIFAAFLLAWHLATRGSGAVQQMDPEYAKLMKEVGLTPPAATSKSFTVMGKTFDPAKPEEYVKSFAIKRST